MTLVLLGIRYKGCWRLCCCYLEKQFSGPTAADSYIHPRIPARYPTSPPATPHPARYPTSPPATPHQLQVPLISPIPPIPMSNLFFTPILNPPLGSTSTRSYGVPIRFYACMQVTAANTAVISPDERFTVLLWYSNNGRGTWRPASFREVSKEEDIVQLVCNIVDNYSLVSFVQRANIRVPIDSLTSKKAPSKMPPYQTAKPTPSEETYSSST